MGDRKQWGVVKMNCGGRKRGNWATPGLVSVTDA